MPTKFLCGKIHNMIGQLKKFGHWFLAWFFYWLYGRPGRNLIVIGVTGTKGKSTTCRFIASVLSAAGYKVGMMTTVEFQVGEERVLNTKKMTMLGLGEIQKMLRRMVLAGCQYAVIETSSQGILQYRHVGLCYDVAVFTNLAPEHVEAHGGFEALRRDKGKLFAALSLGKKKFLQNRLVPKIIVVNTDDEQAGFYAAYPADELWGYGLRQSSLLKNQNQMVYGQGIASHNRGVSFAAESLPVELHVAGSFNVPNALAAMAVGRSQGVSDEVIARGLASVTLVPGRMEFVDEGQNFSFIVDYAHEPLSLRELCLALKKMTQENGGRVIALIGSDGGGRDVGKRETMGNVVGGLADIVIVTDVNCFDEDPHQIAEMLAEGARRAGKVEGATLFVEVDRRRAIELAVNMARPHDAIALTAKGTEPCMVMAHGQKIDWDDRMVAREVLHDYLKKSS